MPHEHLVDGIAALECLRDDDEEAEALVARGWTPIQRCDECMTIESDLMAAMLIGQAWGDHSIHVTIMGQVLLRRSGRRDR